MMTAPNSGMRLVLTLTCLLTQVLPLCFAAGYAAELTSLALSSDQKTLVLGDRIGNISAWDFQTGQRLWHNRGRGQPIRDIGFLSSDQWVIAVEGSDAVSMIYRGKDRLTSFFDYRVTLEEQPSVTAAAAFNEKGSRLVVAGSHFAEAFLLDVFTFVERDFQRQIVLKDFATMSVGPSWQGLVLSRRIEPFTSRAVLGQLTYAELQDSWNDLAWCSAEDRIVGVSSKGYLVAWDVGKDPPTAGRWDATFVRQVSSSREPERSLNAVACSQSGKIATAGTSSHFGALQVWNRDGELEHFGRLPDSAGSPAAIERIAFDRQSQCIMSSGQSGYTLWRLGESGLLAVASVRAAGEARQEQSARPLLGLDQGRFLLLSDEGAWLFDCKSRELSRSFGPRPTRLILDLM